MILFVFKTGAKIGNNQQSKADLTNANNCKYNQIDLLLLYLASRSTTS